MAASYLEQIRAAGQAAAAKQGARQPPAPKPKPQAKAPAGRAYGPPVPANVARRNRAASARPAARRVYGPPVPTNVASKNANDAAVLAIIDRHTKGASAQKNPVTGVTQTAGLDSLKMLQGHGGGPLAFLGNIGREALGMVTSVPVVAQLGLENIAAFNPATMTLRGLHEAGAPGLGWTKDYQGRVAGIDTKAAQATGQDYAHRYGPLLQGDFGTLWSRFQQQPLSYALDVAGAKGAIGRIPSAIARATMAVAPESAAGLNAARRLSSLSAAERATFAEQMGRKIAPGPGGRYRPPRQVRSLIAREEAGKPNVGERVIDVPRPAYSGDATARARQKAMDRMSARFGPRIEARAQRAQLPPGQDARFGQKIAQLVYRPLTSEAKFARYQRKNTLNVRDIFSAKSEAQTAQTAGPAARAMSKLRPDKNVAGVKLPGLSTEQAAVRLHLEDVLSPRAGMTPVQLRDAYVRRVEGGQRAARAKGIKTENATAQLNVIKQIPENLLSLTDMSNPAVRRVARAVDEGRKLNQVSQELSVKAGVISPQTATEAASRGSAIGLGGQRWGPDAIRQITTKARVRTLGIKKQIASAQAVGNKAEVARLQGVLADHVKATKGRIAYIKQQSIRQTPELTAARAAAAETQQRLVEARATGTPKDIEAAVRARDRFLKDVQRRERQALGFTPPRRPELVGNQGAYIPDRRVDVAAGAYTGPRPGGRFSGPDRPRQSAGRLKGRAGMDMNPSLLLHQAKRAADNYTGTISKSALDELISTAAYHDPKTGLPLTGERLRLLSASDANRVALVNVGNLQKALKGLDELPPGQWLDPVVARSVFTDTIPAGARAKDYVAISKDAANVWTEAMTSGNKLLRGFDHAMGLWKGGLLALHPRWYVNNTFGLALQYMLMAPHDIGAIFKGNLNKAIRAAMEKRSPQVVRDTLAADVRGNMRLFKAMEAGFRLNSRLEEVWRRAAYLNRAKGQLRREGVRVGKLSDAELAHALETMPESMARPIVRDMDYFIGNYSKFNKFERDVVKRIVPFYSWLRVISRLTFGLPFRSPVRAAAMSVLSKAAIAGINPNDYALPYYARGSLRGPRGIAVPTWSLNPAQTVAPFMAALGARQPGGALAQESLGWINPIAQFVVSQATGINNFGSGVIAPPGTAMFGQDPQALNPVSGLPEGQRQRIPFDEALLNAIAPGQVGIARKIFSGGRTPFDTTRTRDVIGDFFSRMSGAPRNDRLYYALPKRPKGRTPMEASPYTSLLGAPLYRQNDAQLIRDFEKSMRDYQRNQRRLARKRRG